MKNIFHSAFLIFALLFAGSLSSAVTSPDDAQQIAKRFYLEMFGSEMHVAGDEMIVSLVETRMEGAHDLFYIFNINEEGFVILSACDATIPVLGFSSEAPYDISSEDQVPAFDELLKGYESEILHVIHNNLPASPEIVQEWGRWQDHSNSSENGRSVEPLLTTTWNQSCYYNELCPEDENSPNGYCDRVPVGCVAMAMSQVMKYWNFPAVGTGSHSYSIEPYGEQFADFGNTNYEWDNMPNSLGASNLSVATLNYHCAVSVDMQFATNASGASTSMSRNSLVNYFNYSQEAYYTNKSSYSDGVWEILLRDELDVGRPIIYRGDETVYGHAWVCDGYAADNYFHMNWGWGGYANGYFYLSALNPAGPNFINNQAAILGIVPTEVILDPPTSLQAEIVGGDVHLSWSAPAIPEWIHWDDGMNSGTVNLSGGGSYFAAACWDDTDLEPYDDFYISHVSVFIASNVPEYALKIWKGASATNLIYTQELEGVIEHAWNTIELTNPLQIDAGDELYIGFAIDDPTAGSSAIGIDAGPAVVGKGGLLSLDGSLWFELVNLGFDANWNIQALVAPSPGGKTVALGTPIAQKEISSTAYPILKQKSLKPGSMHKAPGQRGVNGYNIYRDGQKINTALIIGTSYIDQNFGRSTYEYYVTAVYNTGESEPSNMVSVSGGYLTQNFQLQAGWNSISSNLLPVNPDVEVICNPIMDELIFMSNIDAYYYPSQNENTIGDWDRMSGYFVKVDQDCQLPFQGYVSESNTLTLNHGWNLMPVLSDCDVNTEELFSDIENYIRIVKDGSGTGVYWPAKGINTLPVLSPGKVYHVKIFSTQTITFPSCE